MALIVDGNGSAAKKLSISSWLGPGTASGSYSYDEETLKEIAKRWFRLGDKCTKQAVRAERYAEGAIQPPGLDKEASGAFAQVANERAGAYVTALEQQAAFAYAQADKCRQAFEAYAGNEESAEEEFRRFLGMDETSRPGSSGGDAAKEQEIDL